MYDLHVHSNYSDGGFLVGMVDAAADAGLDGVGIADHCVVSDEPSVREARETLGFNLDRTADRRRRAIDRAASEAEVEVYDAVEMDYRPDDESAIRSFLADSEFDYAVGSVHRVAGRNVQADAAWSGLSDTAIDDAVDRYVDGVVALVESGLFEVAAHVDLIERTPSFRGHISESHYRRVAEAFADSRTVPEINAGRALDDASVVHPAPDLFDAFADRGVRFALGSDAHAPDEVGDRTEFLATFAAERDLDPVTPDEFDA